MGELATLIEYLLPHGGDAGHGEAAIRLDARCTRMRE